MRALAAPGDVRAATALLLLAPSTPLIFQGQEYASSRPFLYFADHVPQLAAAVRSGRTGFLGQFARTAAAGVHAALADPALAETFAASKLDAAERHSARGRQMTALFRDLLRLRHDDAVLSAAARGRIDGAVLAERAFVLRYFGGDSDDRLLLVNFGADLKRATIAEPLLAPPADRRWERVWSSEDPRYGGSGEYPLGDGWRLAGHAAALLASASAGEPTALPAAR